MANRQTITGMDLERMAKAKRKAMAANHGKRIENVSLGREQREATSHQVVTKKHLHTQVPSRGQSSALNPNSNQGSEANTQRSEHVANSNATRGRQVDSRVLFEGIISEETPKSAAPTDKVRRQSKMRGFTFVPHIWAISSNQPGYQRKEIEFNEHDKPIGPNKSDYVEFLGSIARNGKLAPLIYHKWTDMPKEEKQAILTHVKGIFIVPVGYDERILQAVDTSWRTYKARIKKKYFNESLTKEQNLRNRPDTCDEKGCDERVNVDHWNFLVNYWSTDKAKEMSNQNKKNRAQKKMQHTTGKRSFAQVYDMERESMNEALEMTFGEISDCDVADIELSRATLFEKCYTKDGNTSNPHVADALKKIVELKSLQSPDSRDIGENDIYSQVLGEDKGGRVHIFGTTKSRIYGGKPGPNDVQRMSKENEILKKRMAEQDELIQRLLRKEEMTENGDSTPPIHQTQPTHHNPQHFQPPHVSTFSSHLKVGMRVILKGMAISSKFIAKGFVENINPSTLVGTEELGDDWCEVRVTVAIEPEERLIRSIGSVKKVGHAVGSSIAWPKHLVVVEQR